MVVTVGQSSNVPEAAQSYLAEADEGLLGLVEVLWEGGLHALPAAISGNQHLQCHSVDE